MRVRTAVIPAAGLGTRFQPFTRAVPKELLPLVDTPVIQLIVEEALASGCEKIVLVTAKGKEALENHFAGRPEIRFVRQEAPLGLGHAVLCAEREVGQETFAVLLGDDLIDANPPCTAQLARIHEREGGSVVAVMEVPEAETRKYGIVSGSQLSEDVWAVESVIEKPAPGTAPSRLAIPGRYVLTPTIFPLLRETKPGVGGEIQLTDALLALARRERMLALRFKGTRYDAGDRLGYLDAFIAYALKRPELAEGARRILARHAGSR